MAISGFDMDSVFLYLSTMFQNKGVYLALWFLFFCGFLISLILVFKFFFKKNRTPKFDPGPVNQNSSNFHSAEDMEWIKLLVLLPDITKTLISDKETHQIHKRILEQFRLLFPNYNEFGLFVPVVDSAENVHTLVLSEYAGISETKSKTCKIDPSRGMLGTSWTQGMILHLDNFEDQFGRHALLDDQELNQYQPLVCAPIIFHHRKFGILTLNAPKGDDIHWDLEKKVLDLFSDIAAITMSHADKVERLKYFNNHLQDLVDQKIHENRKMERELHQAEQFSVFGEFIATLAHDIKTPLAFITGEAQWCDELTQEATIDKQGLKKSIGIIRKNAERLHSDIQNMLAKIKMPELEQREFCLKDLVLEAIEPFQNYCQQRNISISSKLPSNKMLMKGFPTLLKQSIGNLISNSMHSIQKNGQIEILLTNNLNHAHLSVRDNGKGIPTEILPHIFELFYSKKEGGSGLGLSSVKRTVEKHHHGKIEVSTEVNTGTKFTIIIPLNSKGA